MLRIPEYSIDFRGGISTAGYFEMKSSESGESHRISYDFDDRVLANVAVGHVPERLVDFYGILQGLRSIDRYARRTWNGDRRPKEQRGPRRLIAPFPVRDVDFWRASRAEKLLTELVWQLSGDQLQVSFVPMSERTRVYEAQRRLPIDVPARFDAVTLFSGGLDSLFGLISCVGPDRANRTLAISLDTNNRQVAVQSRIIDELCRYEPYGKWELSIVHLPLRFQLTPDRTSRESSFRMRVLGFLAAGILAAMGVGIDRLVVAENGPGALNLPSNATLGGALLNRGMHPTTLKLVAELVSLALERPFEIENIGFDLTKRQMVNNLSNAGFRELLDLTNSCDRFPYTRAGKHCGTCSSCLLRALATLDHSLLFDRLGDDRMPFPRRLARMSHSAAFAHLSLLRARLDEVFASGSPLERLWVIDPNVKDACQALAPEDLLYMLRAFRDDISDLESVVDNILAGRATSASESAALLHRSS
jgi:7-cyano-7-deazaguanine synthase in queuosine biosynthesis